MTAELDVVPEMLRLDSVHAGLRGTGDPGGSRLAGCGKVELDRAAVAQALLPVLIWLHLLVAHSQEWLCHQTFSATC